MMEDTKPSAANIIAPPPLLYLGALFAGHALHLIRPVPISASGGLYEPALVLLVISAAFARWSFVTMRHKGTSANPRQSSSALVTSGPFALSRNPIYVAMTGLYLGITLLSNSWWPLFLLLPLLLIMQWGVIRREETYLSGVFGDVYRHYQSRVRRWL